MSHSLANLKENMPADFLVPNTKHRMTDVYIKCIAKLV